MASPQGQGGTSPPRIPLSWAAIPEQRLYALAIIAATQAFKFTDVLANWIQPVDPSSPDIPSSLFHGFARFFGWRGFSWLTPLLFGKAARTAAVAYLIKWLIFDLVLALGLRFLRIPGLSYSRKRGICIVVGAVLFNSLVFGSFDVTGYAAGLVGSLWHFVFNPHGKILTLSGKWLTPADVISESHLSGGKIVQLLPYGTAVFNPLSSTYCIPPSKGGTVYIPVITNSSNPVLIDYYVQSLEDPSKRDYRTADRKSWGTLGASALQSRQHTSHAILDLEEEDDEELIYSVERDLGSDALVQRGSIQPEDKAQSLPKRLEQTQNVYFLKINGPGLVQVTKIEDEDEAQFRIRPGDPVLVAECPSKGVLWLEDRKPANEMRKGKKVPEESRCTGDSDLVEMLVQGVGSMKVDWTMTDRTTRRTEFGAIEGIEGSPTNELAMIKHEAASGQLQRYRASTYAPARSHTVSLPVKHGKPGIFDVHLHTITDALNNELKPEDALSRRTFHVHQRPSISFSNGCTQSNPLKMLKGGAVALPITSGVTDADDKALTVELAFSPHNNTDLQPWEKAITVPVGKRGFSYEVRQPGIYSMVAVRSQSCDGTVLEPSTCSVEELPVPFANVQWNPLAECAGDIGVLAELSVTGTPPFEVQYETKKKGYRSHLQKWRFDGVKADFPLTPRDEGDYTWTITELSDANYKRIPIKAESFHQVVHPSANITIANAKKGNQATIWTCAQTSVPIEFDLSGTGPFEVEYIVAWGTGSETYPVSYPTAGRYQIDIAVPQALQSFDIGHGTFSVTFTTIKDMKGCVIRPRRASATFDVRSTHPSARFDADPTFEMSLIEGGSMTLPLRLAGEGDWTVEYTHTPFGQTGAKPKTRTLLVRSANGDIRITEEGDYRLTSVRDQHCPGHVDASQHLVTVRNVARPTVRLQDADLLAPTSYHKVPQRSSLCAGADDQVPIHFTGHKPFTMRYKYTHQGEKHSIEEEELLVKSAQDAGLLHLSTAIGKHTYTESGVSDSVYAMSTHTKSSKPAFAFQQTVHGRPRATIHRQGPLQYCQDAYFIKPSTGGSALIRLTGEPPFEIELEIDLQGSRNPSVHRISDLRKHEWDVAIPDYQFASMGTYTIRIRSVSDASGCPFEFEEEESLRVSAEVIEQPSILPASEAKHLCVGDTLDFVLQGTAPWTISYEWEKKNLQEQTSDARFIRLAERPGNFQITGVSHGKAKCKAEVQGFARSIHALPSAKIEGDARKAKKLHQGDDTPIVFALSGEAPFSFTYTRSIALGAKKVLTVVDTQTVTGIMSNTYTIFASQEGVYHVVYVADAFCSYPRMPPASMPAGKLLTNG